MTADNARWPVEREQQMLELMSLGWTAEKIGTELGLTKNAVIGKRYRLGLSGSKGIAPR
jgi:hypothetical protein